MQKYYCIKAVFYHVSITYTLSRIYRKEKTNIDINDASIIHTKKKREFKQY